MPSTREPLHNISNERTLPLCVCVCVCTVPLSDPPINSYFRFVSLQVCRNTIESDDRAVVSLYRVCLCACALS